MLGIDVSNNNGRIDWQKVAVDGIGFAWVKATEGRTFDDKYLLRNLQGAREHGVAVGAYHYARPDSNSPESEADHFLDVYRPQPGDLLPVLDFETRAPIGAEALSRWAKRWMELVRQGLHCEVVFYSYPYFISGSMGGAKALRGSRLWLADYGRNDGKRHEQGYRFPIFNQVAHQFTSNGRVGGVAGRVDLNHAPSLAPILQTKPRPKPKNGVLPGPSPKPKWFWAAVKKFIANRKGKK